MLEDITVGTTATITKVVEEQECTVRGGYQIFSTPYLVHLLEAAAIEALAPFLPEGQASVGTNVHVDHTAATLLGQTLTATATVIEADRRRFVFSIDVKGSRAAAKVYRFDDLGTAGQRVAVTAALSPSDHVLRLLDVAFVWQNGGPIAIAFIYPYMGLYASDLVSS